MQEERTEQSSLELTQRSSAEQEADTEKMVRHAELDQQIAQAQREVAEVQRLASEQQREVAAKLREAVREVLEPSEK